MKILIAPFSRPNPECVLSVKNWPWWPVAVARLREAGHSVVQAGVPGEERLDADEWLFPVDLAKLEETLKSFDACLCVDTWLHHAAHRYGVPCVVVWMATDPAIFGYPGHVHLAAGVPHFAREQFVPQDQMRTTLPPLEEGAERPCPSVDALLDAVARISERTFGAPGAILPSTGAAAPEPGVQPCEGKSDCSA